jgi:tRNA (mo5U34)-methyltransferase
MPDSLLEQVRSLAPWHMDVVLTPQVHTAQGNMGPDGETAHKVPVVQPTLLRPLLDWLYPDGLGGKRFLDCACNAGGYSFLASDMGAEYCFGFDVRDHWIDQARFLKRHFKKDDAQLSFEVCDLLQLDKLLGEERFDVCLFKGIFYHLPDPVAGLKVAADRTRELLILDTTAAQDHADGYLKLVWEGVANPMSGVHQLAWRPTGPQVLCSILEWLGFEATAVIFSRLRTRKKWGRIRIVGARDASRIDGLQEWARRIEESRLARREAIVASRGRMPADGDQSQRSEREG